MSNQKIYIDASARVADSAVIGEGSQIWINVQVRENAVIGRNCIISKDVYIDHGVELGEGCKVQNGVSVYSGVSLGDRVFVGPNATFTNDLIPRAFNDNWTIVKTFVEEGASIGANSTIICGVKIGKFAMVAAGSVVTKDVPPYSLVAGNPARFLYKINKEGKRS